MPKIPEAVAKAQLYLSHGLYVVSTAYDGRLNGLTAAWAARASFVPPRITVAIGKTRHSYEMIKASGVFALHVLGPDDVALGRLFGHKTGRRSDKFKEVPYEIGSTGAPVLKGCLAWLECRVAGSIDAGDHTVFLGDLLDGGVRQDGGKPLVYDRESFYK